MNGLYPGPATAPGANLASGNPVGPGSAIRVGLKSGAPAKCTTAGPKGVCARVGELRVTGCTAAGALIAMVASLGAELAPRSCASPALEATRNPHHTRAPGAGAGRDGSRRGPL